MTPPLAPDAPVYVAGHTGLVGSALVRRLGAAGHRNLLVASRDELDLRDPAAVRGWLVRERPEYVFVAAGTVGGIAANQARPAEFLRDNLLIAASLIDGAWEAGVRKLLYLGSSCLYPREAPQPLAEESLLTGPLEPTNEAYAVAKIAGLKLSAAYRRQHGCDFISAMPTNLYGPGDRFDPEQGHVLPALMHRLAEARRRGERRLVLWGSGSPRREFMHVDDLADCCLFLMRSYSEDDLINIGSGDEWTIRDAAELVRDVVHPQAELVFDASRPDGAPRKRLDLRRLHALGWKHRIGLREGLEQTWAWYRSHYGDGRDIRSV